MKRYVLKYALFVLMACFGMRQAGAKVWYATSNSVKWTGKPAADVKGLSDAIKAAAEGDEIWVGAGEVVASVSVSLDKSLLIYGGFVGTESKVEDRKMVAGGQPWEFQNPTILKAKEGTSTVVLLNQTVNFTKKVIIDGLTVSGGKQGINFGAKTHTETYIRNCIIKGNGTKAGNNNAVDGGGIAFKSANVKVQFCLIESNVGKNGGGVYCEKGKVENCMIVGNYADFGSVVAPTGSTGGWGGGVFNNAGVVSNCIIKDNGAKGIGGGFCVRVPASKFYNCLVVGNTAPYGGGVSFDGRTENTKGAEIYNCIIADNISTTSGGGIYFTNINQAAVNCIFWDNKKNNDLLSVEVASGKTGCTVKNSVIQKNSGTVTGTDNIELENRSEVFDAEGSWLPAENFAGIDKGLAVDGMVAEDLRGNFRIWGSGIDIGAYEYNVEVKPDGDVFYVDATATGKGNGSSWADAFTDIQRAIDVVKVYNTKNKVQTRIWVAAGTYDITSTISIRSGVSLYGGFNKTEKSLEDRKYKINSTNPWDFAAPTVLKGNKTCQIFNSIEPANDNAITEATYIDGFTITGGKTTIDNDNYGCGGAAHLRQNMFVKNCIVTGNEAIRQGGGITVRGDKNLCGVENCLIENNIANGAGGGISLYGNSTSNYVRNCVIQNNESKATGANTGGGGVYNFLGTVENCVIKNNTAPRGGGIAFRRYLATSMINCLVERNMATDDGGAIFLSDHANQANVNIFNCTVVNNQAPEGKGTIGYMELKYKFENVKIVNCIFSGNEAGGVLNTELPGVNITYSAFEKAMVGEGNIVIPNDGTFWAENWHLAKDSPGKNAGTQSGVTVLDYDLDGADRVQDGVIDMGVYEVGANYAPDANNIFYVKVPLSEDEENGVGSSWDNHLNNVAVAVSAAKSYKRKNPSKHVQIWIAGGTYTIPTALELSEDVSIYGGFAGTETSLDQRQKVADGKPWEFEHETILDGGGVTQLFNQKVNFTTTTYVDGLTFRNAKHTDKGGAMYIMSDVRIQYCKFLNNTTSGNGGAIDFVGSGNLSKVVYSYFYGNSAGNGGAIFTENNKAEVENCWVEKNRSGKRGGGIYVYQGAVRNTYVVQNHCDGNEAGLGGGGGLYGRDGGKFYNCIVIGNTSNRGAGIMAGLAPNYSFVTEVYNCVVADNKGTESGAGLYASPCKSQYGLKVYNTVLWNNTVNAKPEVRNELVQLFHCALQNGDGINENVDQNCIAVASADKAVAFDEEWKLVEGSPCIDAGILDGITLPETDYAGNKRISNRKVDIGAYEYQNPADAFKINYVDETLVYTPAPGQVVECSADRDNWVTVSYSSLIQKEAGKGFCRLQSIPERIYVLDIPGRGEASGSLDTKEEALKSFAKDAEWNVTGGFAAIGDGKLTEYITENEKEVILRQPATETAFKSEKVLVIPARPTAPDGWTLSYAGEKLSGIEDLNVLESTVDNQYVPMADSSVTSYLTTDAAVVLKIRYRATDTDFASYPWSIELAARPAAPVYTIHYADSTTVEDVSEYVVYDTVESFANPRYGANGKLKLQPGNTYYFKWMASEEGRVFNSATGVLEVPAVVTLATIRINFSTEKLEGLSEHMCWKINGGSEEKASEDISELINPENDVTLALYVPAGINAFATPEYTVVLPKREAAPQWAINYADEVIYDAEALITPDNWEIKLPGADGFVPLDESGLLQQYIPDNTDGERILLLRTSAGADVFHSEDCEVVLPVRPGKPEITINFSDEKTNESIPADIEYSVLDDMEAAVSGGDTAVAVEPGIDLYFRLKATGSSFASGVWKLTVPERPAISEVGIDFEKQTLLDLPRATVWQVNEGEVTSAQEDLTDIIPAAGQPDATLKIWVPEQENSFKSEVIALRLPAYPADPQLNINYEEELLEGVTGQMVWRYNDTTCAADTDISALIPAFGENERILSVWVAASDTNFRSLGDAVIVLPSRKEKTDMYTVDYLNETTLEVIGTDIVYSYDSEEEIWNTGNAAVIPVRPGTDVWFKRQASAENRQFASAPTKLEVPRRPVITAEDLEIRLTTGDYIPDIRNSWTNTFEGIEMEVSDPEIALCDEGRITPKKAGECRLTLSLEAVEGEHFAAESKTVILRVLPDGNTDGELTVSNLKIAGRSDMIFRIPELDGISGVGLIFYNQRGKVIFEAKEYGRNFDMGHLAAGTYYYVLTYPKNGRLQKKKGFVEIVR